MNDINNQEDEHLQQNPTVRISILNRNTSTVRTTTTTTSTISSSSTSAAAAAAAATSTSRTHANEEEQRVTSTSSDTLSSSPTLSLQQSLDAQNTSSPVRITSTTSPQRLLPYNVNKSVGSGGVDSDSGSIPCSVGGGADVSSEAHLTPTYISSEDDSQASQAIYECLNATSSFTDDAMPTTSAAIATGQAVTTSSNERLVVHQEDEDEVGEEEEAEQTISSGPSGGGSSCAASINNKHKRNSQQTAMVAREILPATVPDTGGGQNKNSKNNNNNNNNSSSSNNNSTNDTSGSETHKIILKLPKTTTTTTISHESQIDVDPTTSSCSNSSSNSCNNDDITRADMRKVEPLKINLLHAQTSSLSSSSNLASLSTTTIGNVVPKITIKPIVKNQNDAVSDASSCSSSAEDELMVEEQHQQQQTSALSSGEPHIVPKLTIRSANEEGGQTHSSIVPKLTIKMSDMTQNNNSNNNNNNNSSSNCLHSPNTVAVNIAPSGTTAASSSSLTTSTSATAPTNDPPPPLPKLTIKTALDGTSESIISSISPASASSATSSSSASNSSTSSTSSSSSSSASTLSSQHMHNTTLTLSTTSVQSSSTCAFSTAAVVPKLTIKPIMKPPADDGSSNSSNMTTSTHIVPKLTIKTTGSGGSCTVSSALEISPTYTSTSTATTTTTTTTIAMEEIPSASATATGTTATTATTMSLNKIPKLTIKTGQEHAVIITQHNDATNKQSIPKLTIKTKSLDVVDDDASRDSPPPEKIPKITIKTTNNSTSSSCSDANMQDAFSSSTSVATASATATPSANAALLAIPKLTITVGSNANDMSSSLAPQSPLVVRQIAATTTAGKPHSPERLPKLMISRQDLVNHHHHHPGAGGVLNEKEKLVPKLTIKTNSSSLDSSSTCLDVFSAHRSSISMPDESNDKIPKFTIKTLQTDHHNDELTQQPQQPHIPKLTIKNLCSPKYKMKVVLESKAAKMAAAEAVAKKFIKPIESKNVADAPLEPAGPAAEAVITAAEAAAANKTTTATTPKAIILEGTMQNSAATNNLLIETSNIGGGTCSSSNTVICNGVGSGIGSGVGVVSGESSNSHDFCGFSENTADSMTTALNSDEPRRFSDDMDIDEALQQQHDPQVFHNFPVASNGAPPPKHAQLAQVIDTVDLTSSPSPGSSPAHHNYGEPSMPASDGNQKQQKQNKNLHQQQQQAQHKQLSSKLLLECLQQPLATTPPTPNLNTTTNILLSQLTAPPKHITPITMKQTITSPSTGQQQTNASMKYPQLAERLMMANGGTGDGGVSSVVKSTFDEETMTARLANLAAAKTTAIQHVIDSIEILDTPEGSPHTQLNDDESNAGIVELNNHHHQHMNNIHHHHQQELQVHHDHSDNSTTDWSRLNNNIIDATTGDDGHHHHHHSHSQPHHHINNFNLKRHCDEQNHNLMDNSPHKQRRLNENHNYSNADHDKSTSSVGDNNAIKQLQQIRAPTTNNSSSSAAGGLPLQHRSRKQKHEILLSLPNDEQDDTLFGNLNNCGYEQNIRSAVATPTVTSATDIAVTPLSVKRRGRPKRSVAPVKPATPVANAVDIDETALIGGGGDGIVEKSATKSRRVQLLRKRLAIDMVMAEQPDVVQIVDATDATECNNDNEVVVVPPTVAAADHQTPKRDHRALRTSRRSATPNVAAIEKILKVKENDVSKTPKRKRQTMVATDDAAVPMAPTLNHFGNSNSSSLTCSTSLSLSLSSSSSSSLSSLTKTTTIATSPSTLASQQIIESNFSSAMAAQIDLTMCSSSSSASNGSGGSGSMTATTVTSVIAGGGGVLGVVGTNSNQSSMLPPTTILSSSDPMPDVIFQPNDFSSIMATQQLRSPHTPHIMSNNSRMMFVQDDDNGSSSGGGGGALDNSGDDSNCSSSFPVTPGRGRGRGRGSRGGSRGSAVSGSARGGPRAHRLGRGASAVAKAIAMSRPRCIGGLKHTPDPERLKGLFSPSPQVFEEDTRMSADMNHSQPAIVAMEPPLTPLKQHEFLNNDESQSSIMSNTSILDPNTLLDLQQQLSNSGLKQQRPKKKKMEVCVAEDTEFKVSTIAEYDWPPPKGCCPSKNRDTFMIQEQVALYLGIKSFKRKYPDLPRRQVDMEERNWLQEKGLVTEKMCDLGLTAVWASDILDIMYTDFYDKYEEYKDFIRQKHLREIEAKQKALGLNVNGRGLQARDRAMLSASKWNAYFNRTRKEERLACLDLQTLTVNVPLPIDAPTTTLVNRPIVDAVVQAAKESNLTEPPMLCAQRVYDDSAPSQLPQIERGYPLSLVPGQYMAQYRHYTPFELRSYPLNTVLDDPSTLPERLRLHMQNLTEVTDTAESTNEFDDEEAEDYAYNRRQEQICGLETTSYDVKSFGLLNSGNKLKQRVPIRRSRRARTAAKEINSLTTPVIFESIELKREKIETAEVNEIKSIAKLMHTSELLSSESSSATATSDDDSSSSSSSSSETDSNSSERSSASDCSTDSDDEYETKSASALCGVCQRTQHRNLKDLPEVFIQCYTCRRKVHPSCIEMPNRMVYRVRNYNWQCADCKCCIGCKRKQHANKMLYCEQCDRGYHIYCLGVKTVPDGRWSCERCSICMRCGATKPEGLPTEQQYPQYNIAAYPNGGTAVENKVKPIKHKKVKWINEYRIDHITKLREHCSMLCVPCARIKPTKRVQIVGSNNTGTCGSGVSLSPGGSSGTNKTVASTTTITTPTTTSTLTLSVDRNTEMTPPPAAPTPPPPPLSLPPSPVSTVPASNCVSTVIAEATTPTTVTTSIVTTSLSTYCNASTITTTAVSNSNNNATTGIVATTTTATTAAAAAAASASNTSTSITIPPPPVVA